MIIYRLACAGRVCGNARGTGFPTTSRSEEERLIGCVTGASLTSLSAADGDAARRRQAVTTERRARAARFALPEGGGGTYDLLSSSGLRQNWSK